MGKFLNIISISIIIILALLVQSCSHTRYINLTKRKISDLDTIYIFKQNHKLFDYEWIFYEKQICQFKQQFIRKKIYTGTWIERNDTIFVNFFYNKKVISDKWKFIINKEKNTIESIQ